MDRRAWIRRAVAATTAGTWAIGRAQDNPARLTKLVVPFPAGGPTDVFARKWAERAADLLGYPVVVDNRAGAGGTLGARAVAVAPADGRTLLFGSSSTHVSSPLLMATPPYDAVRDFASIRVGLVPMVLVVRNGLPVRSVAEFVALLRQRPGAFSYGSAGVGSINHLGGELLRRELGVDVLHVPYKGTNPAGAALAAGEVDFLLDTFTTARPFQDAGRTRILASCGERRSASAPDVPTLAESGWPGVVVTTCNFVAMPAATPAPVREAIVRITHKAMADAQLLTALLPLGIEAVVDQDPLATASAYVQQEIRRWAPVAKASGASI